MTASELASALLAIVKRYGDVDVTYVANAQFCDVESATMVDRHNCPPELAWCHSGRVVVLKLAEE